MLISSLMCEYLCMAKTGGESDNHGIIKVGRDLSSSSPTVLLAQYSPLCEKIGGAKKPPLHHKLKIHI